MSRELLELRLGGGSAADDKARAAAVDELSDRFMALQFKKGDDVAFSWSSGGGLRAFVRGGVAARERGRGREGGGGGGMDSPLELGQAVMVPSIGRALMGVYCDDSAVSWRGRNTFSRNVAAMARARKDGGAVGAG